MLTVITEGHANHVTRFTEDMGKGIIVLKSNLGRPGNFAAAIDELTSMAARQKAIAFAASNGLGDPRINGSPGSPYPVNDRGLPLEVVRDDNGNTLPLTDPRMHVKDYHIDVPVTRRLV